jgi:hypothetical protein
MQAKTVRFVWLLGVGSLSACLFSACNGDEDLVPAPETPAAGAGGESHGAGSAECEAIGRLCHEADTGSGTASECHSTGHEGEAAACNAIFESCIDTCVPAEGSEQGPYCRALGSYCHEADSGAGRGKECHDVGHAGDEEACAEEFDGCITFCRDALEQGGEGGSGGGHGNAGGEGGSHAHAAGGHAGADEHAAGGHGGEDEHAASGASGEHTGGHGGG